MQRDTGLLDVRLALCVAYKGGIFADRKSKVLSRAVCLSCCYVTTGVSHYPLRTNGQTCKSRKCKLMSVRQVMENMRTVRLFNAQKRELARYQMHLDVEHRRSSRVALLQGTHSMPKQNP